MVLPKKEINIKKAIIEINKRTHLIEKVSYVDKLDNTTTFLLKNILINSKISDSIFDFTPPKNSVTTEL